MMLESYLRPGRRLLAVALSATLLAMVSPAWAYPGDDDDSSDDQDKKEVRVYRSGGEDEDGEEGNTFRYRVERADSKGGYLGVQVQDITRALMKARDLSTDEGALVNRVEDESPADDAGVRRGDVIVELNREKIEDSGDLVEAVRDLEPGAKVDVVVLRDGLRKTLDVEIAKRPHDMMMGMPGFQWRGEGGMDPEQMKELRARVKEMDPEKMRGDRNMKMMVPGPQFRQDMDELRRELDELKAELKELKQELRESIRSQSRRRSGS